MIITGTITQAGPPSNPTGQYQVRYQDVTITDQQGHEWHGRIGSKQGYQVNAPIQVTVEVKPGSDGMSYNYFRKHNPQYPQSPPQGGQWTPPQGRQNAPQAPSQPAGGQKSSQEYQRPKTPEEAAKIGRMWAITAALANIHNQVLAGHKEAADWDEYELAVKYKYFADTGEKLKVADQDHSNCPGQSNPDWVGDNPKPTGDVDDIPF